MDRRELSPMTGWPKGGTHEMTAGAVVVPLADVVPADISDLPETPHDGDSHAPADGYPALAPDRVWRWTITVEGTCTRASTTSGDRRRDALLSATRLVEAAKRIVRSEPARLHGTIAHASQTAGLPNGGEACFVLDLELRDADPATIGRVYDRIAAEAWTIGRLSQTRLVLTPHESNPSVVYDVRAQSVSVPAQHLTLSTRRTSMKGSDAPALAQGLRIG
jgi:hypothetical protein